MIVRRNYHYKIIYRTMDVTFGVEPIPIYYVRTTGVYNIFFDFLILALG